MKKILAVDDEKAILDLIYNILTKEGYDVTTICGIDELKEEVFLGYDLIILDIIMPNINGYEICKKLYNVVDCPIIFLTAKVEEDDMIKGLVLGSNDYITKPFKIREFVARVNAQIRFRKKSLKMESKTITISGVTFKFDEKAIYIGSDKLNLSSREYEICELLALNRNKVFTKEDIYNNVYDIDSNTLLRSISEYIYQIRKKLSSYGINSISTIWGVGYKWE